MTTRENGGGGSGAADCPLELEADAADAEDVAVAQGGGRGDVGPVDLGAVGAVPVFDPPVVFAQEEAGVFAGDKVIVERDSIGQLAADGGDGFEVEGRAGGQAAAARVHDDGLAVGRGRGGGG